jgi:hypothetical protein
MDEFPVQRDTEEQDADAPLVRDDSSWFAQQLGDEWRPEEPGIYRFVGARNTPPNAGASTEVESPRVRDEAGAGSEIEEQKVKPAVADAPTHASSVSQYDAEALKRKAPTAGSDILKTKGESRVDKQRFAPAEAVALKKKLADDGDRETRRHRSSD